MDVIASLSLLSSIEGLPTERDRGIVWHLPLHDCADKACSLHTVDMYGAEGRVRDRITFRQATTKEKETRSVLVSPELRQLLEGYRSEKPYLFLGRWGREYVCPKSADTNFANSL